MDKPYDQETDLRNTARELYGSDDIEIDDDAKISEADKGTWVAAWVWVPEERYFG
jgi:hypothetical protein